MRKVVVTGPESSGKTSMAESLSVYFNAPLVHEYSRVYLNKLDRNYNKEETYWTKQFISNEELSKMNDAEWARYFTETIYVLWFHVFSTTLPMYSKYSKELISFANKLLIHI